jgi:hypothetical protein
MKRGLRQAAVFLGASAVGAAAGAGVWTALNGGSYRVALAVALMIVGGLTGFSGGAVATRAGTIDTWAFLGMGPDRPAEDHAGEGLTTLGVFLFVSLPLFVVGLVLFGRG